jgi:hypothetical protein
VHVHLVHGGEYYIIFISKPQHDNWMYFVRIWCGKCQTGSVVTVQSQFEHGTNTNLISCFLSKRSNTTKEFSTSFYVKYILFELSYRFHLKFNLSDAHISWKGYLIGSLPPRINIHLMAYKKNQTV